MEPDYHNHDPSLEEEEDWYEDEPSTDDVLDIADEDDLD